MHKEKTIEEMLAKCDGIITSKDVTNNGIHRSKLQELIANNTLYKVYRGTYLAKDAWEDELYLLQNRYQKGIFSHSTALYLHGMTDRTPQWFTMTVPQGYHTASLQAENAKVKYAGKELYSIGITECLSPCGNPLRYYDLEKTLCDILRGNIDIQVVTKAFQLYVTTKEKNIQKLLDYAEKLRVKKKVLNYLEVLL